MRASRWEILGAWLRIWTPPRDVDVPPVPRRAAALLAGLCVAAIAIGVAVVAPAIDRAKQRDAASERRRAAAATRAERARLRFDQRAQTARATQAARLYAAGREDAALAALVRHVRTSVARDMRVRVAAGEFDVPVRAVRCRRRAGAELPRVRLACLAVTSQTPRLRVGQPFRVAASLREGRYAWCHENPPPGEGAAGTGVFERLPAVCRR